VLRTRKPPASLGVSRDLAAPVTLFRGSAQDAVRKFPANVNVAAALALASGVEPTVEVIADPKISRNIHEIVVESDAAKVRIVVENVPSPENPKTSYLAVLSAIDLLRRITSTSGLTIA
jgi:aspartate dehydrogenase